MTLRSTDTFEEDLGMAGGKSYPGRGIRVTYEAARCIHAAECVRGLPGVFDPHRRPWILAGEAPADDIANVVLRCPTGALSFERTDGGEPETPPTENVVSVRPDGPLYGTGDLLLLDGERRPLARETRVALCRCGASANKPFCDGRHSEVGFRDAGRIGESNVGTPDERTPKQLAIRLRDAGPLVLEGSYTLRSAAGEEIVGSAGALCRCGASSRKPFCDGSHRDIGFQPEDPSASES